MSRPEGLNTCVSSLPVINQPEKGYRYSLDPFLLASFVMLKRKETVIDLGAGVGVIGLLLTLRYPDATVTGIEIQERLFRYAEQNRELNRPRHRVSNIHGDYRHVTDYFNRSAFTAAVSNPPYRPVGTGRKNTDEERTVARHEVTGGISDVINAARQVLIPTGRIFLVYDARRTTDLLCSLRSGGFEPKRVRFVHARKGTLAQMVLVEAGQGFGVEVKIMPPLFIWEETGVYTEEAAGMFMGREPISY
jgi:tRNA1Val (adenine37-N6)-methyltransferase